MRPCISLFRLCPAPSSSRVSLPCCRLPAPRTILPPPLPHPQVTKMTDEAVKSQLQRTHEAIVNGGGVAPKIMRPPYGAFTERQKRWCFGEMGYKVILWDVDPLDWKYHSASHVENEILKHT